jgi:uncharacterized membrane protein
MPPKLPPHVEETMRAMAQLHSEHDRRSTLMERSVQRITGHIGRPPFLFLLTLAVVLWVGGNIAADYLYRSAWDGPPFPLLQCGLQVLAIYMATLILTTQRRADELADLREQMTLELVMLTEKKTAKLIELMEEARRDSPYLRDRVDHEASELSSGTDTAAIIGAIEENNREIRESVKFPKKD